MAMFAVLGDIHFQVLGSPEALESTRAYDYAEHRVIEARPLLQWLANDLERLSFDLLFHKSFTDPSAELAGLKAAAEAHQALALVFGTGDFRGYFVIESIATRSVKLSASGDPIAITVRLMLKEWVRDAELDPAAPPVASFIPLAVIAADTSAGAQAASSGLTIPSAEAGLSALFSSLAPLGAPGPSLTAADVPVAVITRSFAR